MPGCSRPLSKLPRTTDKFEDMKRNDASASGGSLLVVESQQVVAYAHCGSACCRKLEGIRNATLP